MLIVVLPPLLLQTGATPLYIAAQKGHFEVAKLLLDRKADINKAREVGAPDDLGCERCCCAR